MPINAGTIRPKTARPAPKPKAEDAHEPSAKPVVPGSPIAKALAAVWSGAPVTIIDAPPGSGKTEGVVTLVAHLVEHAGLRVLVQVVTRSQGVALAHRLVQQIPPKKIEVAIKHLEPGLLPSGLYGGARSAKVEPASVSVRTVASCALSQRADYDCIVVDEAYQATYADIALGASSAPQIVCVGDPGQIGPIVTIDTSIFQTMDKAPHRPAPQVLAKLPETTRFALDKSFRLGPHSVAAVAPLYDFGFTSAGVERTLVGTGLDNLDHLYGEIEAVEVPVAQSPDDLATLRSVVERVVQLAQTRRSWREPDGTLATRSTEQSEIAVVVVRNSQVSIVKGLLAERGLEEVTVSTADRIQGAEYPVVVALDPLAGIGDTADHALSIGRLCVMISRHTTHLSWCYEPSWREGLQGRSTAAVRGRAVREQLVSHEAGRRP